MSEISQFVDVQITLGTTSISRAGFGVPLIFSKTALFDDVRSYASLPEVAEDFSSSEETYKLATALFGQDYKPSAVKIAKWDTGETVEDELNALVVKDNDWYFLLMDTPSDAQAKDAAAWIESNIKLFAVLSTDPDTKGSDSTDLIAELEALNYDRTICFYTEAPIAQVQKLTFDGDLVASNKINGKIDTDAITEIDFTTDHVTTMGLIATAIQANANVTSATVGGTGNREITVTSVANTEIVLSGWVVTAGASQANIAVSQTTPVTIGTATNRNHAACIGKIAPRAPGSLTWKFKNLAGVVADDYYTSTEKTNLLGKNANIYTTVGDTGVTQEGVCASGEFCDVIRGSDLLTARIEENVYSDLVNEDKIPFTNDGIAVINNRVLSTLITEGVDGGILAADPAPTVTVPDVADVAAADKAARLLKNITFTGTLAGAIHKTEIRGTITV